LSGVLKRFPDLCVQIEGMIWRIANRKIVERWAYLEAPHLTLTMTAERSWFRVRAEATTSLFAAFLIGVLYLATGVAGITYQHGQPFRLFLIISGRLLLISCLALRHNV
jgi:hypothetical protein